jgi:hypothetical protein
LQLKKIGKKNKRAYPLDNVVAIQATDMFFTNSQWSENEGSGYMQDRQKIWTKQGGGYFVQRHRGYVAMLQDTRRVEIEEVTRDGGEF